PTVLRVAGRDRTRARGVATLLHGNEPSGVRALHAWLASGAPPAVDLVCFVGAVEAALHPPGFAFRMLPGRRDLNRCFAPPFDADAEGQVAGEALRLLREAGCEALLDLHNNTGHNPAYGVTCLADAACMNLAAFFGERLVASDLALGALTEATARDFPSVTIECGRAGDPAADATALAGLARYAALERIETRRVLAPRMVVLERPLRVQALPDVTLAFGDAPAPGADLTLAGDIDRHNFELLLPGVPVGWIGARGGWPIEARGADGADVSRDFFEIRGGLLATRRASVPIMMTTDPAIAKSDCLFYLVRPREERTGYAARTGRAGRPLEEPR
ncbi:MAG: succinylglutamate desuccinylase, partial [Proteobacteria bacterium]